MSKMKEMAKKLISNKKLLVMMVACVLAFTCVIGGTIAWLKAETTPLTNTFTVGDINIKLEESDSEQDQDGNKLTNSYKMVPGNTIPKDPKVTVVGGSEACWLFVKVEESAVLDTFISYGIAEGWTKLQDGVYYREVAANAADQKFEVLADNLVTVKSDVTKAQMNGLQAEGAVQPTLSFTAYAVQKDNITTAADAWAKVG